MILMRGSVLQALDWLQEVHDMYLAFANPKKFPALGELIADLPARALI